MSSSSVGGATRVGRNDDRDRGLAPALVRHLDHRDVDDGRVAGQDALDLGTVDVLIDAWQLVRA